MPITTSFTSSRRKRSWPPTPVQAQVSHQARQHTLLIVTTDHDQRAFLAAQLDADGHTVYEADHTAAAITRLSAHAVDVLIVGELEHPADGPALLRAIRAGEHPRIHPGLAVITKIACLPATRLALKRQHAPPYYEFVVYRRQRPYCGFMRYRMLTKHISWAIAALICAPAAALAAVPQTAMVPDAADSRDGAQALRSGVIDRPGDHDWYAVPGNDFGDAFESGVDISIVSVGPGCIASRPLYVILRNPEGRWIRTYTAAERRRPRHTRVAPS
jgi:CheY-like chemotaxis protein